MMSVTTGIELKMKQAAEELDRHLREIIGWHFSGETGCPFWLEWAKNAGWNPIEEIQTFDDLKKFDHFQDAAAETQHPGKRRHRQQEGFSHLAKNVALEGPGKRHSKRTYTTDPAEVSVTLRKSLTHRSRPVAIQVRSGNIVGRLGLFASMARFCSAP